VRISIPVDVKYGCSRRVFLVGRYAIKTPRTDCWRWFLKGLLNNLRERDWKGSDAPIAPVLSGDPFGLVLVCARCEQPHNFRQKHLDRLLARGYFTKPIDFRDVWTTNVGFLGRRLVLVDWE
jgi:hypothetical protein